jgi:hypothetical protein
MKMDLIYQINRAVVPDPLMSLLAKENVTVHKRYVFSFRYLRNSHRSECFPAVNFHFKSPVWRTITF